MDNDGSQYPRKFRKRTVQARNARSSVAGGSDVFELPQSRRQTSATGAGFLLSLFTFAGITIPGAEKLIGQECRCRKKVMDEEHPLTCGINGRWHVHNRVRDVVARLVTKHSQGTMAFVRSEPRGKDFHITVDSPIGPDAEFRQHGNRVLVDYSGVADSRNAVRHLFQAQCTHTGQHKISLAEALKAGADDADCAMADPVHRRDTAKYNGAVGMICARENLELIPCTFLNSGGLSDRFYDFLRRAFLDVDDSTTSGQWGTTIRTTLQYARHTITATIVNAHAEYVIANMRSAFATRGKTDVELAWWHANKFPMHRFADTFDDVISTAVATGALGSGIAGPALRGGVVA